MAQSDLFDTPPARRVWSVSEVVYAARDTLEDHFAAVWVRGEIGNLRRHASGHWYFNLKDPQSVLPVAMFRSDNARVPFRPEEGLEVTALGRLTVFPAQGRFQLIAEALEPVGWGSLQLAFEQLQARLHAEGLFADERKRPLPLLPTCVAVVTSADGYIARSHDEPPQAWASAEEQALFFADVEEAVPHPLPPIRF